jgi:nicotinate-nucleotide adenylyltransferase
MKPQEIALFGTSADPPSIGHRSILAWLAQNFDLCVVWVSDNPFKQHQATLEQRLAMMELTIADLQREASNILLAPHIAHSRTIFTVEKAKQIWRSANFTLVIGADVLPTLPKWYRSADLLSQVKILVMPRAGIPITAEQIRTLEDRGTSVAIAPVVIPDVSSTAYRHHHDKGVIIPSVAKYIEQEKLYQQTLSSL